METEHEHKYSFMEVVQEDESKCGFRYTFFVLDFDQITGNYTPLKSSKLRDKRSSFDPSLIYPVIDSLCYGLKTRPSKKIPNFFRYYEKESFARKISESKWFVVARSAIKAVKDEYNKIEFVKRIRLEKSVEQFIDLVNESKNRQFTIILTANPHGKLYDFYMDHINKKLALEEMEPLQKNKQIILAEAPAGSFNPSIEAMTTAIRIHDLDREDITILSLCPEINRTNIILYHSLGMLSPSRDAWYEHAKNIMRIFHFFRQPNSENAKNLLVKSYLGQANLLVSRQVLKILQFPEHDEGVSWPKPNSFFDKTSETEFSLSGQTHEEGALDLIQHAQTQQTDDNLPNENAFPSLTQELEKVFSTQVETTSPDKIEDSQRKDEIDSPKSEGFSAQNINAQSFLSLSLSEEETLNLLKNMRVQQANDNFSDENTPSSPTQKIDESPNSQTETNLTNMNIDEQARNENNSLKSSAICEIDRKISDKLPAPFKRLKQVLPLSEIQIHDKLLPTPVASPITQKTKAVTNNCVGTTLVNEKNVNLPEAEASSVKIEEVESPSLESRTEEQTSNLIQQMQSQQANDNSPDQNVTPSPRQETEATPSNTTRNTQYHAILANFLENAIRIPFLPKILAVCPSFKFISRPLIRENNRNFYNMRMRDLQVKKPKHFFDDTKTLSKPVDNNNEDSLPQVLKPKTLQIPGISGDNKIALKTIDNGNMHRPLRHLPVSKIALLNGSITHIARHIESAISASNIIGSPPSTPRSSRSWLNSDMDQPLLM